MIESDVNSNDATGTAGRPDDFRHPDAIPSVARLDDRQRNGIAIIGMSCLFPSAPNLDSYWRNILGKVDAVTDPPLEAQETERYFDPASMDPDRVYCKRGGYLGSLATFDPLSYGIPPVAVGGEPDQWLALRVAHEAMADAGCLRLGESVSRKTAVILGKGTYLNAGNAIAVQHGLVVNQTLEILRSLHPEYTDGEIEALRQELKRSLPPFNPETMAGLVPNVIVGRIANRLDLMGPTYTVDAACASSLIAVQQAMRHLVAEECDLALAGGSQVWIPMPTMSIFCQLGALSRRQQIRPFDKQADGTLLGEGIGMVVLKRASDAERDGDRIYAVIKGVGIASDGRGASVMAPRVEGEELALRRAYESAGVSPRTVELIEAHGTGTPVGDVVEVQALTRVFGQRGETLPWCALGSVKSMISHTIPAAGVAGIIKAALSLYHKVLPPSIHCDDPNPKLELNQTPFYISTEVRPWVHGGAEPRRAGVNAFGFGGINAHIILEEHNPKHRAQVSLPPENGQPSRRPSDRLDHLPDWECEVFVLGSETTDELLCEVRRLANFLDSVLGATPTSGKRDPVGQDGKVQLKDLARTLGQEMMTRGSGCMCRLALVASSLADLREKLARAAKRLGAPDGCRQIRDVSGIYFNSQPLGLVGKLAFLFPGEGSQYPYMLDDLCLHFPEVRECFDQIDQVYFGHPRGYVPTDHIFPRRSCRQQGPGQVAERLWEIAGAVEAVLTANQAMFTILQGLGLQPDVIVGHSTGDFSAVRAAGIFDPDEEQFGDFILQLYRNYEEASRDGVPRAVLLAVAADREHLEAIAQEAGGAVFVAMDNCPHQAVLVGEQQAADRALEIIRREGLIFERLNFDRAYHTPLFTPYADHLRRIFKAARIHPARIPVYSCATAAPYPGDEGKIRDLLVDQWFLPVEFRRTIEALYADGVRLFVEVGPRGNLTSFVEDALRGRPFCAVPANVTRRSGIAQLNHLVATLTAQGVNLDLMYLYRTRDTRRIEWEGDICPVASNDRSTVMKLATGFPAMQLSGNFARQMRAEDARLSRVDRPDELVSPHDSCSGILGSESDPRMCGAQRHHLPWDRDHTSAVESQAEIAFSSQSDTPEISMIQNFLQTMDRFLTVQGRVIQDCLETGPMLPVDGSRDHVAATTAPPPSPPSVFDHRAHLANVLPSLVSDGAGQAVSQVQAAELTRNHYKNHGDGSAFEYRGPTGSLVPVGHHFPLLGSIVSWTAGERIVVQRIFNTAEDLYLLDHTLGSDVSVFDPSLHSLAVMPLAMSMEIMAEAAALLMPGRTVVGLRDLRAHRWIAFEDGPQEIEVTAYNQGGNEDRVAVVVRNLAEDSQGSGPRVNPVIEATVLLADTYPQAPHREPRRPRNGRSSFLRPELLYTEYMFHGPRWQGVAGVEEVGDDGSVAILRVLPSAMLFRSNPDPRFVLDPLILDAAGQVIGFWTMERLATGRVIFPYRLASLEIYRPRLAEGELATCFASIQLIGGEQVCSEIEVIAERGRPWMRLVGWEDKRFDPPAGFHSLMRPFYKEISEPWPEPVIRFPQSRLWECRRITAGFTSDRGFWKRVWAHRILGRAEREQFRRMTLPESRQLEWLAGRTAAKEAIRQILRSGYGLDLLPADIEIGLDARGCPEVYGPWVGSLAAPLAVAIAHRDGVSFAVAGLLPGSHGDGRSGGLRLGVALEPLQPTAGVPGERALSIDEIRLLRELPSDVEQEWLVRGWCAKCAVLEALGEGLSRSAQDVTVAGADRERGVVTVRLADRFARLYPDLTLTPLIVFTGVHEGLAWATTHWEFADAGSMDDMAVGEARLQAELGQWHGSEDHDIHTSPSA